MALSRAARTFNKSPTAENFRKLADQQPAEATSWVREFGFSAKLPERLLTGIDNTLWDGTLTATQKTKKLEKLLATYERRIERAIANATQADEVSPVNLGWTTVESPAQVYSGRLVKSTNGVLQLKTAKGTYAIAGPSSTQLSTSDLSTFLGNTVSIRGYLENAAAGRGKALLVTEWTPGQHRDFVSGRVASEGEKIGIRVNDEKFVEITNPQFKSLLKDWERAGMTFPGEVKRVGKRWVFEGAQPVVNLLTSLGDPPPGTRGQYTGAITPAQGTTVKPTTITGPKVTTQGYVRRFIAGRIVAQQNRMGYPARAFEMAKAWKACDGAGTAKSAVEFFRPVADGAGQL